MTVAELMERLSQLPHDLPVVMLDGTPIERAEIAPDRAVLGMMEVVLF